MRNPVGARSEARIQFYKVTIGIGIDGLILDNARYDSSEGSGLRERYLTVTSLRRTSPEEGVGCGTVSLRCL